MHSQAFGQMNDAGLKDQGKVGNSPLLVTGAHRSGTTWVGKMLAASGEYAYVSEPLNVWHRVGVFSAPVENWYTYICEENEAQYLAPYFDVTHLNYHLWEEVKSLRSIKDVLRMGRDWGTFTRGRLTGQRVLLKDPFAVFSAPWFANRLGCQVVVVIRHPAGFVSSLKRLGWSFNFKHLLSQPLLMRDWLGPFRTEMETAIQAGGDLILVGSLLWRMVYSVVGDHSVRFPSFKVVRHEDLSMDPQGGFEGLYKTLGIRFTGRTRSRIRRATSERNPPEASGDSIYSVRLDSKTNVMAWKQRLNDEDVTRLRTLTEDVAGSYYSDDEWN
jgi:hypothetical protein